MHCDEGVLPNNIVWYNSSIAYTLIIRLPARPAIKAKLEGQGDAYLTRAE